MLSYLKQLTQELNCLYQGNRVFEVKFIFCPMIDLKKFVEMLERDEEARARIADILATEIALRSRKLIVRAVLKEVATKDDIKELRSEIKETEEKLRKEIKETEERLKRDLKEYVDVKIESLRNELKNEIRGLEKRLEMLTKFMLGTFIGIILTLVSIILTKLF